MTRSMHAAQEALNLPRLEVIHAGEHTFPLREGIRAISFAAMDKELQPM